MTTKSYAQGHPPAVIEAQSFALVDSSGKEVGVFNVTKSQAGEPVIRLELGGHEVWRAPKDAEIIVQRGRGEQASSLTASF